MDATTLNTIVGIVGIVVGAIGAGVGIIGWKCISTAVKIKANNKVKANNGSVINQTTNINHGLSLEDTSYIAKKEAGKMRSTIVTPEMALKLDSISYSVASMSHQGNSSQTFVLLTRSKTLYTFKFETEQDNIHYPNVKCSISNSNGTKLNLHGFSGFMELIPTNIFKDLSFEDTECSELVLAPNQTIVGKAPNGDVLLATIKLVYSGSCHSIRMASYTPVEVTP